MAVSKNWMLFGAASQVAEHFKALDRCPPMTHPVIDETKEFNHFGNPRHSLVQLVQDPSGIVKALLNEGPGCLVQSTRGPTASPIPQGSAKLRVGLRKASRNLRKGLSRHGTSARAS